MSLPKLVTQVGPPNVVLQLGTPNVVPQIGLDSSRGLFWVGWDWFRPVSAGGWSRLGCTSLLSLLVYGSS